jgi:hypothetical protein
MKISWKLKLDRRLSWYSRICLSEMDASSVELGLFLLSGRASWDFILDFVGRLILVFTVFFWFLFLSPYTALPMLTRTLQITSIPSMCTPYHHYHCWSFSTKSTVFSFILIRIFISLLLYNPENHHFPFPVRSPLHVGPSNYSPFRSEADALLDKAERTALPLGLYSSPLAPLIHSFSPDENTPKNPLSLDFSILTTFWRRTTRVITTSSSGL